MQTTTLALTISPHQMTDTQLDDALDELVSAACTGDRRALTALVLAFGTPLLAAARQALGPQFKQEAPDAVQDLYLAVASGELRFVPGRDRAATWLIARVTAIAQTAARERHRDWGEPE